MLIGQRTKLAIKINKKDVFHVWDSDDNHLIKHNRVWDSNIFGDSAGHHLDIDKLISDNKNIIDNARKIVTPQIRTTPIRITPYFEI